MDALDRRRFLVGAASIGAAYSFGPGFWRAALAADPAAAGPGPYGDLREPDENGIRLPEGFTSAKLAESLVPVSGTAQVWHQAPDGGAVFPADDGGWVYVSNSEIPVLGGVTALRFDSEGEIADAYPILVGTSVNCAGGPTPWGSWLSCEEFDIAPGLAGQVWECDPLGPGQGVPRPALGRFSHEAACVDPVRRHVYLSEDQGDGRFYRFTPASWRDDGDGVLSAGPLEAAAVDGAGAVSWLEVPDPLAVSAPTRQQLPSTTAFDGGEGLWFDSGTVYLATKGDRRVWAYDTEAEHIEVLYDATPLGPGSLDPIKVDNVVVSAAGEVFVAEDSGGRMRMGLLSGVGADPVASTFLELIENTVGSELTGPAFDPSGTRLYFSSQRGASRRDGDTGTLALSGITYVVSGPFTRPPEVGSAVAPGPVEAEPAASPEPVSGDGGGGLDRLADTGGTGLLALGATAALAGLVARRRAARLRSSSTVAKAETKTDG